MAHQAKRSSLLRGRRVEVIPNGVDLKIFRPTPKRIAREALGLPEGVRVVLFGAMAATTDPNKGWLFLREALNALSERSGAPILLVVAGTWDVAPDRERVRVAMRCVGPVRDELLMAILAAAADVVAVPSRTENLPFAAIEAHACGTPVVAFKVGGVPEVVLDRQTGLLVDAYDVKEFTNALESLLDPERSRAMGLAGRSHAVRSFGVELQASRYRRLYEEIVSPA
jgi:glycosyltransferase involved in cell wall biosynthesis